MQERLGEGEYKKGNVLEEGMEDQIFKKKNRKKNKFKNEKMLMNNKL